MRISVGTIIFFSFIEFPLYISATDSIVQENNKPLTTLLSKRNVYFQKIEELLSQVAILQLRVQHIQHEFQELKESIGGRNECPVGDETKNQVCDDETVRDLENAVQSLREELQQEKLQSDLRFDNVEEKYAENSLELAENADDLVSLNVSINAVAKRLSREIEDMESCIETTCKASERRSIKPPSYISPWIRMKANDAQLSRIVIEHGLNELPAKVDVQIKSVTGADNDWIFSGASVFQADDDPSEDYGGIVYFYNETHVVLIAPKYYNNIDGKWFVVTTGNRNGFFIGSHHYRYTEGKVRVRIWLQRDFPTPAYKSKWYPLDITSSKKAFHSIRHGLWKYPAFVTVQVRSRHWVSEAAGSSMFPFEDYVNGGGVLYGFDDRMVRLWAASMSDTADPKFYGRLFGTGFDGWGDEPVPRDELRGEFKVTVWDVDSFVSSKLQVRESNVLETETGSMSFPAIDVDNDIVSFYVQALDGPNEGFLFKGWGSSQAVRVPFGGAIYAYNKQGKFQVWYPNPDKQGYLIHINRPYGNGKNVQASNSASYVAQVIVAEH